MGFFSGGGKVMRLERIICDMEQNLSNNYKDEARNALKALESELQVLLAVLHS